MKNSFALLRSQTMRERTSVTFPNGETRGLPNIPAAPLIKAVLEIFVPRFLILPGALRVALPGERADVRGWDESQALNFGTARQSEWPNIILVDLAHGQLRLIFVDTVTGRNPDRGMTNSRKQLALELAANSRTAPSKVFFVSAFSDRSDRAFRKLVSELAWGTFAWFTSEPEKLLALRQGKPTELASLFKY